MRGSRASHKGQSTWAPHCTRRWVRSRSEVLFCDNGSRHSTGLVERRAEESAAWTALFDLTFLFEKCRDAA